MRKRIVALFAALLMGASALGFAACEAQVHSWDEGALTTAPTCITPGVMTYTCTDCGAVRREVVDANGEHHWSAYECDEEMHRRTCTLCGAEEEGAHGFADQAAVGNQICTVCGYETPLTEYAYRVAFDCDAHVTITIYRTQDYSSGEAADVAYSRDSDTGELVKNGDGQVNFSIEVDFGYELAGEIAVTPDTGYKNLKGPEDTGRENTWRITKIGADLTVTVRTQIAALDLPVVEVDTQEGAPVLDKENYVTCTVSLSNTQEEYCFEQHTAGIRGRGNSTWYYPKKPYRIKFDEKTSLFGWPENKSWVLLALYQDFSNIKDYAAFALAAATGGDAFVPHAQHVELYLNGEYMGLYLLTDQVDENAGRTGVEEDFAPDATQVPFLVEWDEYAYDEGTEGVDWFRIVNEDSGVTSYYAVKYPESDERYTQAQFDYIRDYIQTVNALCHDASVTREQFEEYIDLTAFLDYYFVQEIMGQSEINWKSIYMSKTSMGKLVMGPVWDFDWSAGGPMSNGGTGWTDQWCSTTNWFAYMLNVEWFREAALSRWTQILPALTQVQSSLAGYKQTIAAVAERNALLWDFDEEDALPGFSEYYDWVVEYIGKRIDAIGVLLGYTQ